MRNPIRHIFLFILFGVLQILFFNQVSLFDLATPFVFLIVVFMLPFSLPVPIYYAICFVMGLVMDWFSSPCLWAFIPSLPYWQQDFDAL